VGGGLSLIIHDNQPFCPCASFYRATIENIVDEILFVTDMDAAFAATEKCRQEIFSGAPVITSTIVQIQRLAFPDLMIEIRCVAKILSTEPFLCYCGLDAFAYFFLLHVMIINQLVVESDRFYVYKFKHPISRQFSTKSTILDTTEWNPGIRNYHTVNSNYS
jgi:hypothetical protein